MARTAQLWFAVIGLAMAATTPGSDGPLVVQCGSCRVAAATTEGVWRPLRQPGLVSRLKGGFQKGLGKADLMKSITQKYANEELQKSIQERIQAQIKEKVEKTIASNLLKAGKNIERQLDDNLIEEGEMSEEEVERLREQRILRMKKAKKSRDLLHRIGHGSYHEVDQHDFFEKAKSSPRVLVHFYRATTFRCEILHRHMRELAKQHTECLFICVNVERAPFLVERLNIMVLPCLKLIKKGEIFHTILGFDEFGGHDEFKQKEMEAVLIGHGLLLASQGEDDVSEKLEDDWLDLDVFD